VQHWNITEINAPDGSRSPQVLHSQEGQARVVAIHLQPGQELGEHQVKENAWVVVVDGTVQVTAGSESVDLGPGGLVRFEPGERHSLSSPDGARVLMVLTPWPAEGHYAADGG
jgi:quercetin dioxygenase-like cupin family protein